MYVVSKIQACKFVSERWLGHSTLKWEMRNGYTVLVGEFKRENPITSSRRKRKYETSLRELNPRSSRCEPVSGCCKDSNEHSVTLKGGKLVDLLTAPSASGK